MTSLQLNTAGGAATGCYLIILAEGSDDSLLASVPEAVVLIC